MRRPIAVNSSFSMSVSALATAFDLDSRNVKSERGKAQSGFADLEAAKLAIEDALDRPGIGPFPIRPPTLTHKPAKGQDEENTRAACWIEHLGSAWVFDCGKGLVHHQ